MFNRVSSATWAWCLLLGCGASAANGPSLAVGAASRSESASPFDGASAAGGAGSLPFESLHFSASKAVVLSGDVRIRARALSAAEALPDLRSCQEGGALPVSGESVVLLDATTDATLHHSQELTWIDADTLSVLQTLGARKGRRWRLSRATLDGEHRWTRRPDGRSERKRSVDDWTARSDEHLVWARAAEVLPRSSSFGLLYQAAALRLDREGATAAVTVHAKGQTLVVTLTAKELVDLEVDLQREQGGELSSVKGKLSLRRVSVSGDAVDDEDSESPVGLLGMSSDIELFLEPGTGLPVEVRGVVPKLGGLRVRLVEAVLP